MSDYSYPYPAAQGRPVSGVLAGSPPPSPPGDTQGIRIAQGPFQTFTASSTDPNNHAGAINVPYPSGTPTPLHYVQVYNLSTNPCAVSQGGSILDIIPPTSLQTLKLTTSGAPLTLAQLALSNTTIATYYVVWSSERLSEDVSFGGNTTVQGNVSVKPFDLTGFVPPQMNTVTRTTDGTTVIASGSIIILGTALLQVGPGSATITDSNGDFYCGVPGAAFVQTSYPWGVQLPGNGAGDIHLTTAGSGVGTGVFATVVTGS